MAELWEQADRSRVLAHEFRDSTEALELATKEWEKGHSPSSRRELRRSVVWREGENERRKTNLKLAPFHPSGSCKSYRLYS